MLVPSKDLGSHELVQESLGTGVIMFWDCSLAGFLRAGRIRAPPRFCWALPAVAAHFDANRVSGILQTQVLSALPGGCTVQQLS